MNLVRVRYLAYDIQKGNCAMCSRFGMNKLGSPVRIVTDGWTTGRDRS